MSCAVLFCRRRSIYKTLPDLDVYDEQRDARTFLGGLPVVAHPPCRSWGRLSHMSRHGAGEADLALFAVRAVRVWGGVLEHPSASRLWSVADLPRPGGQGRDRWGGWTLPIDQSWFGHRAPKKSWLYVVGVEPSDIPPFPLVLGRAAGRVELLSSAAREATPRAFALWLIQLAALSVGGSQGRFSCLSTSSPAR